MARATELIIHKVYAALDSGKSPMQIAKELPISWRNVYNLRDRRRKEAQEKKSAA